MLPRDYTHGFTAIEAWRDPKNWQGRFLINHKYVLYSSKHLYPIYSTVYVEKWMCACLCVEYWSLKEIQEMPKEPGVLTTNKTMNLPWIENTMSHTQLKVVSMLTC